MKLYLADYYTYEIKEVEGEIHGKKVFVSGSVMDKNSMFESYHETKDNAIKAIIKSSGEKVNVAFSNFMATKHILAREEARHERILQKLGVE